MTDDQSWRPTATFDVLRRRAELLYRIRQYFSNTGALEVETPTLALAGTPDPALSSFIVAHRDGTLRYLQTSPEFAMKRLLAAGSGDIYQLCCAYRQEEQSLLHQEEFTMLEWYRVGRDHHALMDDVTGFLNYVGLTVKPNRHTYAEVFREQLGLDPLHASNGQLADLAVAHGAVLSARDISDRALILDYLFGCKVLPALAQGSVIFIYDFPVEHAAYARIRTGTPPVAERFELIINGMELANGFHEVCAVDEQRARFERENERRQQRGLASMALDHELLAALTHGMPTCAGVALGVDRLLMCLLDLPSITQAVAFATRTM